MVLACVGRRRLCGVGFGSLGLAFAAGPALGQASRVMSPLTQAESGNQPDFFITPTASATYDSNVLRANDQRIAGPKDDGRFTPGVRAGLDKLFGRTRLSAAVSAGYDFHTRFKQLNQLRLAANASAETPVGAICRVKPSAQYSLFQTDLAETTVTGKSTARLQDYDLTAGCYPLAGFNPILEGSFQRATNSFLSQDDLNTSAVRGQFGYTQPSLGTIALYVDRQQLDRTRIEALLGARDNTSSTDVGLWFQRAVAPRVHFTLSGGYLSADPTRAGVPKFSGASFSGLVTILPQPNFSIALSAARTIQGQSSFNVTYVVREDYIATLDWHFSRRSSIQLAATQVHRRFRGEEPTGFEPPRIRDKTTLIGLDYQLDIRSTLLFGLHAGHSWRDDPNGFYNYTDTTAAASIGARF